jgi:hypothetical protein
VPQPSGAPGHSNDNGTNSPNTFGNPHAQSAKMYKLNANTNKTGLGMVLKVMPAQPERSGAGAGDRLNIWGLSWYSHGGGSAANSPLVAIDLINAFLGGPQPVGGNPAVIHGGATSSILSGNTAGTVNPLNGFIGGNTPSGNNNVKAGLCYILFDEQFKFVSGGYDPVNDAEMGGDKTHLLPNVAVPKNGYIYIYCSNESNMNVYFDNIEVSHDRGALLEETQYYPFGLVMKGISSRVAGTPDNKYKYNGKSSLLIHISIPQTILLI